MGTAATTPARPPAPTTPGNIGTPGQPLPPMTAIEPTLEATLKRIAEEQGEDAEIAADMEVQGKTKPTNKATFRLWVILQEELVMLCGMVEGSAQVQPIHSVSKYVAAQRNRDPHNGKLLGAIGDRDGDGDPVFVQLKTTHLEWEERKLLAATDDTSAIARWYDDPENRNSLFNTSGEQLTATKIAFPTMPMVPAELGLKIVQESMTPWEMLGEIDAFVEDRDDIVKNLLKPARNWALAASVKSSANAENSIMACNMIPVTMPSKQLKKFLAAKLDRTLGERTKPIPQVPAPSFTHQSAHEIAQAALIAMNSQQQMGNGGGQDLYSRGITDAMRLFKENVSEGPHKRFTDVQKGAIMGFCGITSWNNISPVWKDIESSKSDADLRRILAKHWGKNKNNLSIMFYDIHWSEELIMAIRKVEFTESGTATFITSEEGISLLQLLPRSPEEIAVMEGERKLREKTVKTLSYTEAKKMERAPRLPTWRFEDTMMLFTTYALFLEMLFGQNNQHLQGLNAVRGQLMAMAQIRKVLTPMYFANVVWAVLDDGVRHFNECMPFDDLQGITSQMQVVWPRTDLHNFAKMMRGNQNVALLTLPTEWEYAISTPTFEKAASAGGGGVGSRTQVQQDKNRTTGKGGGGGGSGGGKGGIPIFRDAHPERYEGNGQPVQNHHMNQKLKAMLDPLRNGEGWFSWRRLMKRSKTSYIELAKNSKYKEGVCATYTGGSCGNKQCTFAHLYNNELPSGFIDQYCQKIQPGIVGWFDENEGDRGGDRSPKKHKKNPVTEETKDGE